MKSAVLMLGMIAVVLARRQNQGPRIINGRDAKISSFPSMVSIRANYGHGINYGHVCGGTLLNEEWVLTVRN